MVPEVKETPTNDNDQKNIKLSDPGRIICDDP